MHAKYYKENTTFYNQIANCKIQNSKMHFDAVKIQQKIVDGKSNCTKCLSLTSPLENNSDWASPIEIRKDNEQTHENVCM